MFSTGSPYSPFFTSGLLMTIDTPASSRSPSPDVPLGPRRGSLPTDSLSPRTDDPDSAAFYFTMQPKRDHSEFRSFLSLDLAESRSMRSASLKRKASSKHSRMSRPSTAPSIPEVPRLVLPSRPSSPAAAQLRMRFSRDSFRSIPSPKPAPSMTLPDLPTHVASSRAPTPVSAAPPRLPSIRPIASLQFSLTQSAASGPSRSLRISRTKAPSSPVVALHRQSFLSQTTTSSVSTRVRKLNRSDALARLEGRVDPPHCKSKSVPTTPFPSSALFQPQRNFMSMSDDEDDDSDSDIDSIGAKSDYEDGPFFHPFLEEEDLVLPSSPVSYSCSPPRDRPQSSAPAKLPSSSASLRSRSMRTRHTRKHSAKDWFPLKSFIDLHNDDDQSSVHRASKAWSWRGFIDVAHLP